MGYMIEGNELETDEDGYLLEPNFSDEAVNVIAAAEGIELTPKHWEVINYTRDSMPNAGVNTSIKS